MSLIEGIKIRDIAVLSWVKNNGDKTHSIDHDLNSESLVIDFGGYTGEWAEKIVSKYGCSIEIYEPFSRFVQQIESRFQDNLERVKIFQFAVSNKDTSAALFEDDLATRIVENNSGEIRVVDASSRISGRKIDLLKMNIEGSEYEVFDSLFQSNEIKNIKSLLVQFHPIDDDSISRYNSIFEKLSETHECVFRYPFIWEKWTIRGHSS